MSPALGGGGVGRLRSCSQFFDVSPSGYLISPRIMLTTWCVSEDTACNMQLPKQLEWSSHGEVLLLFFSWSQLGPALNIWVTKIEIRSPPTCNWQETWSRNTLLCCGPPESLLLQYNLPETREMGKNVVQAEGETVNLGEREIVQPRKRVFSQGPTPTPTLRFLCLE